MSDDTKKKVLVKFKPRKVENPEETRELEMSINESRLRSASTSEIKDIANRKAVEKDVISPHSSLKYWVADYAKIEKRGNFKLVTWDNS